jgi:hypothetical protein
MGKEDKPKEINNSREFISGFLKESVGLYVQAKIMGSDDPNTNPIEDAKENIKGLLEGMISQIPEDSNNRDSIMATAKILSDPKALDEYVKNMEKILLKETNSMLAKPNNKLDKDEALVEAALNSTFVKASNELLNKENSAGSTFWKKAAEFFQDISPTMAKLCIKRNESLKTKSFQAIKVSSLRKALVTAEAKENKPAGNAQLPNNTQGKDTSLKR